MSDTFHEHWPPRMPREIAIGNAMGALNEEIIARMHPQEKVLSVKKMEMLARKIQAEETYQWLTFEFDEELERHEILLTYEFSSRHRIGNLFKDIQSHELETAYDLLYPSIDAMEYPDRLALADYTASSYYDELGRIEACEEADADMNIERAASGPLVDIYIDELKHLYQAMLDGTLKARLEDMQKP